MNTNARANDPRRIWRWSGLGLLLLVLLVGTWWLSTRDSSPVPAPPDHDQRVVDVGQDSARPISKAVKETPEAPVLAESSQLAALAQDGNPVGPVGDDSEAGIRLKVVDSTGEPVVGLHVRCRVVSRAGVRQRWREFEQTEGNPPYALEAVQPFLTDGQGVVALSLAGTPESGSLFIASPDVASGWQFQVESTQHSLPWGQGVFAAPVTSANQVFMVIAARIQTITLPIRFDDQRPFTGFVQVYVFGAAGAMIHERMIELKDAREFTSDLPEAPERVVFTSITTREGFKARHVVEVRGADVWGHGGIIVPAVAADAQAGLVIDLTGFEESQGWRFTLRDGQSEAGLGRLEWGKEYRTNELTPGRVYVARIDGPDGKTWQSDAIVPVLGEVIQLRPTVAEAARVKLRAVDSAGAPVFPSFATIFEFDVPRWSYAGVGARAAAMLPPGYAYGDVRGDVLIDRLPVTATRLYVEAKGYGRVAVDIQLQPGQTLDVGEIRLPVPIGAITLSLRNFPANEELVLVLSGGYGTGELLRQAIKPGQAEVRLTELPFREYRLLVCRAEGPRTTTLDATREAVRLTAENPAAEVVLDYDTPLFPRK